MRRFTQEETGEILRTAHIFAPQFTEEQYQRLVQMQSEMADSRFIEAAWGVHRLEREQGTPCSKALDRYIKLQEEISKVQSELSQLRKDLELQREALAKTSEAVGQAREAHSQEEAELAYIREQAETERKLLQEELEQSRESAHISREEIAVASELKGKVEGYGVDLDLALGLFEGFAQDQEAANHLARATAEYGSQLEATAALHREKEALRTECEKRQEQSAGLKSECERRQEVLSRMRQDIAEEEKLHHFYRRFQGASRLLEILEGWPHLIPMRCHWFLCGARFWVDRGPADFRARHVCPCCGVGNACYDDEVFVILGINDRGPLKVPLGE